ncbi:MAG: ATP-binding protein [Candidatus Woesearchaeota archaeon]
MIPSETLRNIFRKQKKLMNEDLGVKRDFYVKPLKKFAYIITGVRRCGKSTLLKQHLEGKEVNYILFEDINLTSFQAEDFTKLDLIFTQENQSEIYFFDEVQNVTGWEIYVRQLLDAGKDVFITGSNATLMSKELGTRLTGRNIKHELFPFSFREFCSVSNKKPSLAQFELYVQHGGMPEYVLKRDVRILKNLVDDIIYKDVIIRRNIREEKIVREIMVFLLSNIAKPLSFTQIARMLGTVSVNTVIDIIDALEQAYVVFVVHKFDYSLKKQSRNDKKIYVIDTGLANQVSFRTSADVGRFLENIVFLHLRKHTEDIYYFHKIHECDFVVKEGLKITQAIQVCYNLNSDNQNREFNGLIEVCSAHKLKEGLLLTYKQEDTFTVKGIKIIVKPVWKWLLE